MDEGAEEAENGGFGELGAVDDLGEAEVFAEGAEGFEDLTGTQHGLRFVAISAAGGCGCGGGVGGLGSGLSGAGSRAHRITRRVYIP